MAILKSAFNAAAPEAKANAQSCSATSPGRQANPPDPTTELLDPLQRLLQRQAGLAAAAEAGQGQET